MERHRESMRALLASRDRREKKRDVSRLTMDEVLGELDYRGCALNGPEVSLRERLLRAIFREQEPNNRDIPWCPWDNAPVEDEERLSEEELASSLVEEEAEAERSAREVGENSEEAAAPCVAEQQQDRITLDAEDVVVHVPVVSATTSSPIIMRPVTTVATSASSTATMVTPLTSMRMTPGISPSIFSTRP